MYPYYICYYVHLSVSYNYCMYYGTLDVKEIF